MKNIDRVSIWILKDDKIKNVGYTLQVNCLEMNFPLKFMFVYILIHYWKYLMVHHFM